MAASAFRARARFSALSGLARTSTTALSSAGQCTVHRGPGSSPDGVPSLLASGKGSAGLTAAIRASRRAALCRASAAETDASASTTAVVNARIAGFYPQKAAIGLLRYNPAFIMATPATHPFPGDRPSGNIRGTRSAAVGRHGMIATSQALASAAGLKVLRDGGNAIDAAVTAAAVLAVIEPSMNGIGGDLFALVYDANTKRVYGLNASGRAPAAATLDEFT